ncbi:ScbR family autoregulator-binding transcription factor [Kitasatospora sp. NPDC057198]|uniref:ScbR family autoregulator-binding transcription factor n=1 Tax=Kitasatospora sp. NPDC057198 TaxID=3346046 RepID=UPI0036404B61
MVREELKQERAVQTRAALLKAAAEAFDELGYAGASVAKILERAGLTPGAMYFHFKNKEDLAAAVASSQQQTVVPYLESEGVQRVVDTTLLWARQLRTDPVLRAGVRLGVERDALELHDASTFDAWTEVLAGFLRTGAERGELQAGVDVQELAEYVVSCCTGIQIYSEAATRRADLTERLVRMWQMVLPGVAVPAVVARIDLSGSRLPAAGAPVGLSAGAPTGALAG